MPYNKKSNLFFFRILLLLVLLSGGLLTTPALGQQMRKVTNNAFQRGEKMVYRVYYNSLLTGNVTAGEATLEILPDKKVVDGREVMHLVSLGKTKGMFNTFYKVVNRYETYLDEEAIAPLFFMRRIRENKYRKDQDVHFDHVNLTATTNTDTVPITPYVQDIISAFYYARTYDFEEAQPGDEFEVDFFLDDSVYVTRIVFDGREKIRTRLGTFNTLRFKPMVLAGSVFSQPYPMTMWISDDENKIPILLESGIIVGKVRLELNDYEGLRNPLSSKIE